MQNLVGRKVRCISTGRVYRAVGQSGGDILAHDNETGEHAVLSAERVVQHSPFLICVGAVIQTVALADYAPLGDSAHLIRGGFLGSLAMAALAWLLGMSAPVVLSAYLAGGLIGLAVSATGRYRLRLRQRQPVSHLTPEAKGRQREEHRPSSVPLPR